MRWRGREKVLKGSFRSEPIVSGDGTRMRASVGGWGACSPGGWVRSWLWPSLLDAVEFVLPVCAVWRARRRRACVTRAAWERMKLTVPAPWLWSLVLGWTNWMIWNGSAVRLGARVWPSIPRLCPTLVSSPPVKQEGYLRDGLPNFQNPSISRA